jgi:hypothetical protein
MADKCFNGPAEAMDLVKSTPTEIAQHLYKDLYSPAPCGQTEQWRNIADAVDTFSHLSPEKAKEVDLAYKKLAGDTFLSNAYGEPRLVADQKEKVAKALGLNSFDDIDNAIKSGL